MLSCVKLFRHPNQERHRENDLFITDYFECLSGVKQGCVLSPILFSIFISEFEKNLSNCNLQGIEIVSNDALIHCLLYADDLVLFADSIVNLQKKINALEKFCEEWSLKVNIEKSKVMVFRNGGYLKQKEKWWLNNVKLEVTTYYSYLGALFSSRLNWSKCIDNQSSKALRIISLIRNLFKTLDNFSLRIASKIFDIKIKPIILYGSEIWGTRRHESLEHVQIKFYKLFWG